MKLFDAAIQLRNENKLKPGDIVSVELIANPLVLSLTGKTEPKTGLEGKFSIYHCIAVGLSYGAAGERQFQDEVVRDPTVVALRRKVTVHPDAKVGAAQCTLMVKLKDGRTLTRQIAHAIGSLEKPMSDAALAAKFTDLAGDFAATIRGIPKEDLLSEEVKQQRRALRLALEERGVTT